MKSPHIPEMAGGEVEVIGEAVVRHGVRDLQTFVPGFMTNNFVPNEESSVSWYRYDNKRVVIRVEKGGTNDGLLGTNAMTISWIALGR